MKRLLKPEDIISNESYLKIREIKRKEIIQIKKNRRVSLGPYATFSFENYDTMWYQVQEMLRIECGGLEQLNEELDAYNPLIPSNSELIATFMIEIENAVKRNIELRQLTNIEKKIELKVKDSVTIAVPEEDVSRTKDDGKTSAVHFIKFLLDKKFKNLFCDLENKVELKINHPNYSHSTILTTKAHESLINDLT